jgi:hypothetical protein
MENLGPTSGAENSSIVDSPKNYRITQVVSGCGFLAAVGTTCILIFVAAFPILPVALVGGVAGVIGAFIFIWSTIQLKKLAEERENKSPPPELDGQGFNFTPPGPDMSGFTFPGPFGDGPGLPKSPEDIAGSEVPPGSDVAKPTPPGPSVDGPGPPRNPKDIVVNEVPQEEPVQETLKIGTINDSGMDQVLGRAKFFCYLGKQGGKFLFACADDVPANAETLTADDRSFKGTYFTGDWDPNSVLEKLGNVECLSVAGQFLEGPKRTRRNKMEKLQRVIFRLNGIKNFETAECLQGDLPELKEIKFHSCNELKSIRVNNGNAWWAENLSDIYFSDCPILDEIHVGNSPERGQNEQILQLVHFNRKNYGFKKGGTVTVHTINCNVSQKDVIQRKSVLMNKDSISCQGGVNGFSEGKGTLGAKCEHGIDLRNGPYFKVDNDTLIITCPKLAEPIPSLEISTNLFSEKHVRLENFASSGSNLIKLSTIGIKHIEIEKVIPNCTVDLAADTSGAVTLQIDDFPEHPVDEPDRPVKMSFKVRNFSAVKILPRIVLRNVEMKDITWHTSEGDPKTLVPVNESCKEKAKQNALIPIAEGLEFKDQIIGLSSEYLAQQTT